MAMSNKGLSKLVEELGELQQVAGKMLAYGTGDHPDGKGPLLKRFEEEAADVVAAIAFCQVRLGASEDAILNRAAQKVEQFKKWDAQK